MTGGGPPTWRDRPVPWQLAWTGELYDIIDDLRLAELRDKATSRRIGVALTYADERPEDRDAHGVLWMRAPSRIGEGEPAWKQVHPLRQRAAMAGLCQVCGGDAIGGSWMTPTELFIDYLEAGGDFAGPFPTTEPPVCPSCLPVSASACPYMSRAGYVLISAESWANTAMQGYRSNGDPDHPRLIDEQVVGLPGSARPARPEVLRLFVAKAIYTSLFGIRLTRAPEGLGRNLTRSPVLPSHDLNTDIDARPEESDE